MTLSEYITILSQYHRLGCSFCLFSDKDNLQFTAARLEVALVLNNKIISVFENVLGLQFVNESETGNVCYASHNRELQDDFKQIFTQMDVLNYFYAILHASKHKEFIEVHFEDISLIKNTTTFWKLVRLGGELRTVLPEENIARNSIRIENINKIIEQIKCEL